MTKAEQKRQNYRFKYILFGMLLSAFSYSMYETTQYYGMGEQGLHVIGIHFISVGLGMLGIQLGDKKIF